MTRHHDRPPATFSTDTTGLDECLARRSRRARPTATPTTCASRRSSSSSATTGCACSPTTGRSPARRSVSARDPRSTSASATTPTSRPPSTGTGSASTTGTTACPTRRRRRSPSAASSPTAPVPGPGRSTGTTRTSARTTGSTWACTATIVVVPADADYWAPVNREVIVTLDDVLVEDGQIAPFHGAGPTYVAMGRFGNVMLTGGDTSLDLDAQAGEVVRLYLTNTANTRLFNVALPGARMKLVGGDSGRYEHETFVDEVLLAPSERAIARRAVRPPGTVPIEHRTPGHTYTLGTIVVAEQRVERVVPARVRAPHGPTRS